MPGLSAVFGGRRGRLLKTGQTTQYSSELDDGYYEKGLAKSYTILTAGQYSGTVNVDLIHYTAATIAFAATTPGTITDSVNGLALFLTGDVIVITGSASNNGVYNVSTGGVVGTIRTTEATVLEAEGATVNIAKREAMSNNCVLDNNTGLMWATYQGTKQGTASNGKMPWTGQRYDIFQFAAAANAALLGGYGDWKIPNANELLSLVGWAALRRKPDSTAFPAWPSLLFWTSTTNSNDNASGEFLDFLDGAALFIKSDPKTISYVCTLVRGG